MKHFYKTMAKGCAHNECGRVLIFFADICALKIFCRYAIANFARGGFAQPFKAFNIFGNVHWRFLQYSAGFMVFRTVKGFQFFKIRIAEQMRYQPGKRFACIAFAPKLAAYAIFNFAGGTVRINFAKGNLTNIPAALFFNYSPAVHGRI